VVTSDAEVLTQASVINKRHSRADLRKIQADKKGGASTTATHDLIKASSVAVAEHLSSLQSTLAEATAAHSAALKRKESSRAAATAMAARTQYITEQKMLIELSVGEKKAERLAALEQFIDSGFQVRSLLA
jgi:hypothetical protein